MSTIAEPIPTLICQCGCGQVIPPKPYHRTYQPRYILKHFLKMKESARTDALKRSQAKLRIAPPDGWIPPSGLCECGCGQPTPIAKVTRRERGQYIGYPLRYITGHNYRGTHGPDAPTWKGGRWQHQTGYIYVYQPEHPHANDDDYVLEHRLVYEQAHGVQLTATDIIHHVNGIRDDNRPENLVRTTRSAHMRHHMTKHDTPCHL